MEEQQINIREELSSLETQIGEIMVTVANDEKAGVKREVQRLSNKIEDILNYYGAAPSNEVAPTVSKINWQTVEALQKEVEAIREIEYNETKANVGMIEGKDVQDTVDTLAHFEQSGVVQQDARYADIVERICNSVVDAYKGRFAYTGDRGGDAYLNIKSAANNTITSLQTLHSEHSQIIKQEVARQVSGLGIKLNDSLSASIDQKVDSTMEDILPPLAWDLESSLSASTYSPDEIAKKDAEELSADDDFLIVPSREEKIPDDDVLF